MNIIYKNTNSVEKTNISLNDLADLCVYAPQAFHFDIVLFYIDNEVIEFNAVNSDKAEYIKYTPVPNRYLKVDDGSHNVCLHGIDFNNKSQVFFIKTYVNISFSKYNEKAMQYCSECLGDIIQDKYTKIIQLTELNTKIYDAVKELKSNG